MNYRTVPLEIPGKVIADLGKLAMEQKAEFSEFIEGILAEYLEGRWNEVRRKIFMSALTHPLVVDTTKCTGCQICELACALEKEKICNPRLSRKKS
jgi:NAD-dependent dihydropyrimidine dehydrogenase PreA subunit